MIRDEDVDLCVCVCACACAYVCVRVCADSVHTFLHYNSCHICCS